MTLPGELERLLNDLGFNWPEIDEQRLFELGGSWSSYGTTLQQISADAQRAAEEVWSGNSGPAIEAFKARWEHEKSPAQILHKGATAGHALGAVLMVCAAVVLALKINVIVQLTILLMEILGAIIATFAVYRAGESIKPWQPGGASLPQPGELRG